MRAFFLIVSTLAVHSISLHAESLPVDDVGKALQALSEMNQAAAFPGVGELAGNLQISGSAVLQGPRFKSSRGGRSSAQGGPRRASPIEATRQSEPSGHRPF